MRELIITMLWFAAPFLVTMPIFSRDVYSYLAQGTMTVLGVDAYQYGPAILGGPLPSTSRRSGRTPPPRTARSSSPSPPM